MIHFQSLEQCIHLHDIDDQLKVLRELATLALCIKDGLSVEDVKNYICPNILPKIKTANLDTAISSLYDGWKNSYFLQETDIFHTIEQLQSNGTEKLIAIITAISALPLDKEETLHLMLPGDLLPSTENRIQMQYENICTQEQEAVSILYFGIL